MIIIYCWYSKWANANNSLHDFEDVTSFYISILEKVERNILGNMWFNMNAVR